VNYGAAKMGVADSPSASRWIFPLQGQVKLHRAIRLYPDDRQHSRRQRGNRRRVAVLQRMTAAKIAPFTVL